MCASNGTHLTGPGSTPGCLNTTIAVEHRKDIERNTMERYWKAKGQLRKDLLEWEAKRIEGLKTARRFARGQGASSRIKYATSLLGMSLGFIFKAEPDFTLWRNPGRGSNIDRSCWVPRRATKAAKELSDELHEIEISIPSHFMVARMIKMDGFSTPGVCIEGNNAYLVTPESFKGHSDLTEITNVTYRKACSRVAA